jgi:hypothetical protein
MVKSTYAILTRCAAEKRKENENEGNGKVQNQKTKMIQREDS